MFPAMTFQPTDLFASLAHETRVRCVVLLMRHPELCVCELMHAIGAAQPHVSRHLAQLREVGLVTDRREGLWIFYRINPALPDWVAAVLSETAAAVGGERPFVEDERVLAAMPNRPASLRCA
jgi:ArsR family transcriptional regulator